MGQARLGHAAHQSIDGQHGGIAADAVAGAEVDLERTPPVGRIAGDDARHLHAPGIHALDAELRPQPGVFLVPFLGLHGAGLEDLIGLAERFDLPDQFVPRQDGVAGEVGEVFDGVVEAENGQEQPAQGALEVVRSTRRQLEQDDGEDHHHCQCDVMRPFKHSSIISQPPARGRTTNCGSAQPSWLLLLR